MSWPKTPEHGHAKLGDKPAAAEGSIMTNQQEAPKSTALDGKTELFHVLGHPLLVRAVDFNRLYAEKERLAALVEAQQPAQAADSVQEDAARYRWLREGNDAKHGAAWHIAVNLYGCEWDAAIDAAARLEIESLRGQQNKDTP